MKKLILVLIPVVIAILFIYFIIPRKHTIEAAVKLPCVPEAAFRILSQDSGWQSWWPGTLSQTGKSYQYAADSYTLTTKGHSSLGITIETLKDSLHSQMNFFALPGDSMLVNWQLNMTAGNHPLDRIGAGRKAANLKKSMDSILSHIRTYLSDFKNVYGSTFHEGSITDTFLITTKFVSPTPPSLPLIYSMIDKLKNFCGSTGGCSITGNPMLNITPKGAGGFQVMVALPVNHFIPVEGVISGVKMVPGKFIITDVTGGPQTIEHIHRQLQYYFQDYHRTAMAIPFEYLLTDRLQETDTSKWRTRIYAPVY